ncbi:VOC family protein [Nesterenkonia sp.]|uniref:VOC family protein n=1 Tax=Nesterenkonia sp. TaxID=704201 RepID=UPI0026350F4A|nr:VOC family protein [Nesterenkonia sp.]
MTCYVSHTTINCANAYELSEWWKRLLDYTDVPGDPNGPGHDHCMIVDPGTGHRMLFLEVEDPSPTRQIHLDLRPRGGTRDAEIERVRALGAAEVADHRGIYGPGSGWVVFSDPEGNLFCVLRSDAEVEAG